MILQGDNMRAQRSHVKIWKDPGGGKSGVENLRLEQGVLSDKH